jgi:DNA-binding response OmpR family regulator
MENDRVLQTGESHAAQNQCQATPFNRILVVDDDAELRLLSAAVLVDSGYQVDTAEDGAAGWDALHAKHYDLLITDNNMPKVSGVELVKKLRSARMALPVILTSGALPTELLNRQPWLRLAATLAKPFAVDELLDTVKKVLRVTESRYEEIEPLPNSRSQPSEHGLQL